MKRRSRIAGKPIKGRHGNAPKPKRGNAPKTGRRSKSTPSSEDTIVARLTHELRETAEQHTATSEILRVISSSPSDLQPVFQAMLQNAVRLCDAKFGNIYRWDGDALHLVASQNVPAAFVQARGGSSLRPNPQPPRTYDCEQKGGSCRRYACGENLCRSRSVYRCRRRTRGCAGRFDGANAEAKRTDRWSAPLTVDRLQLGN
jgi:hypothetical protein